MAAGYILAFIKMYRFWNTKTKKWVKNIDLPISAHLTIEKSLAVTDINDFIIFEGDIVRCKDKLIEVTDELDSNESYEIVGNIHEPPQTWKDLPVVFDEQYALGGGTYKTQKRKGKVGELLDIYDIDDPLEDSTFAQVLRLLRDEFNKNCAL